MGTNSRKAKKDAAKIVTMRLLSNAVFGALIAFSTARQIQLPFINTRGWMINSVPYDKRVYWMQLAKQALHNASGPW